MLCVQVSVTITENPETTTRARGVRDSPVLWFLWVVIMAMPVCCTFVYAVRR